MTTPTQKHKQLAERIVNRLTFAERVSTPKDYTVVAQLLADADAEQKLREALEKYCGHLGNCDKNLAPHDTKLTCTCGLDTAKELLK